MSDIRQDPNDNDQVADLLKHATRRAPAPAATRERAYARLHEHWSQRTAQKQSRRNVLQWALAASMLLAVGLLFTFGSINDVAPLVPVAELQRTSGNGVQVINADGSSNTSSELAVGQTLRTGAGSRAALALSNGGSLRIDARSEIELVAANQFRLHTGAVYFDSESAHAGANEAFSVDTPYGLVTHVGTQFQTRLRDNALTLSVREGEVALAANGQRLLLPAGDEIDLNVDGVTAERKIRAHDDLWRWVQDIAPSFDSEGRSVQALLDWIARETGYRVHYRDDATAEFASRINVHGMDRLEPLQALHSIPYIADLKYELIDGVIEISLLDLPR
jgi:ferric-dicitrate binding protein FerR (iron transport regulator)